MYECEHDPLVITDRYYPTTFVSVWWFDRNIFVKMQYGPVQRVDPADLISALRLDHSVQQDGQEFMKLFLSLLERAFENTPALKDVISSLFRGKSGYQTRCLTCNELSSGSYRFDDFSELEIPIKGFKSLSGRVSVLPFGAVLKRKTEVITLVAFCRCFQVSFNSRDFGRRQPVFLR